MPDKTLVASSSFIRPGIYDDPIFLQLMLHYCDIEFAARGMASSGSYGHKTVDFDAPVTVYVKVRCLLQDVSQNFIQTTGRQGEVVADKRMWIPRRWLPASMMEHSAAALHQVVNVRTLRGELIQAGPFDVKEIIEAGGVQHHYELALVRAG